MTGAERASPQTIRRIEILFYPEDQERARLLLREQCGNNLPGLRNETSVGLERFRFAALKLSDGNLAKLEDSIRQAKLDWRDLLVAAGFADNTAGHLAWVPKPAGEPSEIDPTRLAGMIHHGLEVKLTGFRRDGDLWRREAEVAQSVRLIQGLTSRIEVRFFLEIRLEAKPAAIFRRLPKPPRSFRDMQDQGYIFKAGGDDSATLARLDEDFTRFAQPWIERFTSAAEVNLGLRDDTFKLRIPLDGGSQLLIL